MRMGHSIKLGMGRSKEDEGGQGKGESVGVQVGGLSLAGSTRTANTLRLCAVRRLKKRGRRRRKGREATARTCILAKGNGAHRAGPVPQSGSCSRRAAFKVHTSLPAQCVTAKWRLWLSHYTPRMATKQLKKAKSKQVKTARYFFSSFLLRFLLIFFKN